MSPSSEHEEYKQALSMLVEMLADALESIYGTLARRHSNALSLSADSRPTSVFTCKARRVCAANSTSTRPLIRRRIW